MFDATKETLIIHFIACCNILGDIPFLLYHSLYGFADFKGPAYHGFIQYFRAGYMDFVCFKVRMV